MNNIKTLEQLIQDLDSVPKQQRRHPRRKDNRTRLLPGDPRHGTANGYNNHYCRCQKCTTAWAKYVAKLRKKPATREATRRANRNSYQRKKARMAPDKSGVGKEPHV